MLELAIADHIPDEATAAVGRLVTMALLSFRFANRCSDPKDHSSRVYRQDTFVHRPSIANNHIVASDIGHERGRDCRV